MNGYRADRALGEIQASQSPYAGKRLGVTLLILVPWTFTAMGQLEKNLHNRAVLACAVMTGVIATFLFLLPRLQRRRERGSRVWIVLAWLLIACAHLLLYPFAASKRSPGAGSDRENALVLADTQLVHHHFPYYPVTFAHNPISPMPGSLLLSIPFFLLGRVGYQCLLWTALLALSCEIYFSSRVTSAAFLVIILLLNPGVLDEFIAGDDYTLNAIYVAVGVLFWTWTFDRYKWQHFAACMFLGTVLSSRPLYVVLFPLLLAWLLQQNCPLSHVLKSASAVVCVAGLITLPFFFYDTSHFSPLHVWDKLHFLSSNSQRLLGIVLPAAALGVSCFGFCQRLTVSRLFLMAGTSSAVILFPVACIFLVTRHFSLQAWYLAGAVSPCLIFFGLWGLRELDMQQPNLAGTADETG